jgi:transcription elongation factor Elf1
MTQTKTSRGRINICVTHPELLNEWAYNLNTISPADVSKGSKVKVWWVCPRCSNPYCSSVSSRALQGTGCPSCRRGTSKQQLRIYSELVALFDGVIHDDAGVAYQADIALTYQKIAIEHDGLYWHESKVDADRFKNRRLNGSGWIVIRVRDNRLPLISKRDIRHNTRAPIRFAVFKELLNAILETGRLTKREFSKVKQYLGRARFENDNLYRQMLVNSRNPRGLTVADHRSVAEEWDSERNNGLSPGHVASRGNYKAGWKCVAHGHRWRATVHSRIANGHGCPACAGQRATQDNNLAVRFPKVADFLIVRAKTARELAPFSELPQLWECAECSETFECKVEDVTSRFEKSGRLPHCANCRIAINLKGRSLEECYPDLGDWIRPEFNDGLGAAQISYGSEQKRVFTCPACNTNRISTPNNLTGPTRAAKCLNCGLPAKKRRGLRDSKSDSPLMV